ncbi:MAG TPA: glycine zipper domain-containing protein [Polyangiaceae bacterium]|nr:glycine zipper domain-containing protein [Polyangiaceae bacterium]
MDGKQKTQTPTPRPRHSHHGTDAGAVAGELVGAVVGSAAGPVGTVAGMVVGAVVGALAGHVLEDEDRQHQTHDQELDEAIGVTGGDLGAAGAVARRAPAVSPDVASGAEPLDDNAMLDTDDSG